MAKPKYPPIDEALGVVLARKFQMNMDLKTLAGITGYNYDALRKAFTKGPKEWTPEMRDRILTALGLRARIVIEPIDE